MFTKLDLSKRRTPAGVCIYCGHGPNEGIDVFREHVIPFTLDGKMVIRKASCQECADEIHTFESPVLNSYYVQPRTLLELPMYHPEFRPTTLRVGIFESDDGAPPPNMEAANFRYVEEPLADHQLFIAQPIFPPPDLLTGVPPRTVIPALGMNVHTEPSFQSRRGERTWAMPMVPIQYDQLYRFAAKIAHGAAYAELGPDGFVPMLPNYVRGIDPYVAQVVGTATHTPPKTDELHCVWLGLKAGYWVAHIQLFAKFGMPVWEVIVGRPIKNLQDHH